VIRPARPKTSKIFRPLQVAWQIAWRCSPRGSKKGKKGKKGKV
jgi:hypothetical protein